MRKESEDRRRGLVQLLGGGWGTKIESDFIKVVVDSTIFEEHPFDLDLTTNLVGRNFDREESIRVLLVACPFYTDLSVRALSVVARYLASDHHTSTLQFRYLRIIKAEIAPRKHNMFFEIGSYRGVFIAGGCTDFSGEGGGGKEKLENLFAFLSDIFEMKIELATIPSAVAKSKMKYIDEVYWKHNCEHD